MTTANKKTSGGSTAQKTTGGSTANKTPSRSHTQASRSQGKRRERVPIANRNRLKFGKREGYHRHVFNNDPRSGGERIQAALDAGYTPVQQENCPGVDEGMDMASQLGTPVQRSVGGGVTGVLMEIPQEYHDADNAAKQADLDEIEEGIRKQSERTGFYGKVSIDHPTPRKPFGPLNSSAPETAGDHGLVKVEGEDAIVDPDTMLDEEISRND